MEEARGLVGSGNNGGGGGGSSSNRNEEQRQHERRDRAVRALQLTVESGLLPDSRGVQEACLGLRNARHGGECHEVEGDGVAAPVHEHVARIGEGSPPAALHEDLEAPCAARDPQRPRRALKVVLKPSRHPPSSYFKSRVAAAMATANEGAEMAEAVAAAADEAEAEEEAAAAVAAAAVAAANRQRRESSLLEVVLASFREAFGAGRGGRRADGDDYYDNDGPHGHDAYEPFPSAFVC